MDGEPISDEEGRKLLSDPDARRVAKDTVGDADISTVLLVLNHAFGDDSKPMIFETMIFGGERDQECWRYATKAQALYGHAQLVKLLRNSQS